MVDWSRGSSIGGEFSAPNWVSWEPELTAFALGYDDAVVIYRTQHEVSAVATLSIEVPKFPPIPSQTQFHSSNFHCVELTLSLKLQLFGFECSALTRQHELTKLDR